MEMLIDQEKLMALVNENNNLHIRVNELTNELKNLLKTTDELVAKIEEQKNTINILSV